MESLELVKAAAKILDEKKGKNITAIETTELTIVSDYFLIVSASSVTHTKSLADDVEYEMKKNYGISPNHIEGRATGWILLDYGSVIIHVFQDESRDYYNLERLWTDAHELDLSDIISED